MMGLLGDSWDDPKTQATMQLAAGLLSGGNFGEALGRGLQGYQQSMSGAQEAAARAMQMKAAKLQLQQQEDAAEYLKRMGGRSEPKAAPVTSMVFKPEYNAERQAAAAPSAPGDVRAQIIDMASSGNPILMERAKALAEVLKLNEPKYQTVGDSLVRVDGGKPEQVFQAPPKPEATPSEVRQYEYARNQGYKGTFQQWVREGDAAKAPKVAVDLRDPTAVARAGLDFQDKVRGAFKDDNVIANQFRAMQDAYKNPSAQGDTALLYSFFKVLDPASTVREGEIDMVKASRSIPDRFKGYAMRLANGQLLLPNERLDLLNQAARQVQARMPRANNEVRAYRENARRLSLDPELYTPDPYDGISMMNPMGNQKPMPGASGAPGGGRPSLGAIFGR